MLDLAARDFRRTVWCTVVVREVNGEMRKWRQHEWTIAKSLMRKKEDSAVM